MRKCARKKKLFCELFPFHYLVLNNLQGRGRERLISWFRLFVTVRHHKKAYISSSRHMSIMKKNIIKEATAANDYIRCHKKMLGTIYERRRMLLYIWVTVSKRSRLCCPHLGYDD